MKTGIAVADAMTLSAISVTGYFSVGECARVMAANKIGAVVVIENDRTKGIITERDIVRKAVASGIHPARIHARDIMEKSLVTISPQADIYDAMVVMRDHDIRHLPVVRNGVLVGFLTMKDILKVEPELFDLVAEHYSLMQDGQKRKKDFFEPIEEIDSLIDE